MQPHNSQISQSKKQPRAQEPQDNFIRLDQHSALYSRQEYGSEVVSHTAYMGSRHHSNQYALNLAQIGAKQQPGQRDPLPSVDPKDLFKQTEYAGFAAFTSFYLPPRSELAPVNLATQQ